MFPEVHTIRVTPGNEVRNFYDSTRPIKSNPAPMFSCGCQYRSIDNHSIHTYPVCMANVTFSIPDDLLNRGRSYAQTRGTSLNALIRELLNQTVTNPDSAVDSMIERLKQSVGDSKGVKINREELHRY